MVSQLPLVSIICPTYNHEKFIPQALDGFIIQKTDFRFEIIVHDDASTDNTAQIVKAYEAKFPHLFANIYQSENQFSKAIGNVSKITFAAAKGKYLALCEGDDYWTDPFKLQKQVDYLEAHSAYSICWTRFKMFEQSSNSFIESDSHSDVEKFTDTEISLHNIFDPYITMTLTSVFRTSVIKGSEKFAYFKDNTLYALALSSGKGMVLGDITAVYRKHAGGIWSALKYSVQLMTDFDNFNEIYTKIPAAKTEHIKKWRDIKLNSAIAYAAQDGSSKKMYRALLIKKLKSGIMSEKLLTLKKIISLIRH